MFPSHDTGGRGRQENKDGYEALLIRAQQVIATGLDERSRVLKAIRQIKN